MGYAAKDKPKSGVKVEVTPLRGLISQFYDDVSIALGK